MDGRQGRDYGSKVLPTVCIKECFYKYIHNKKRVKVNVHPLVDAGGNIVTEKE